MDSKALHFKPFLKGIAYNQFIIHDQYVKSCACPGGNLDGARRADLLTFTAAGTPGVINDVGIWNGMGTGRYIALRIPRPGYLELARFALDGSKLCR